MVTAIKIKNIGPIKEADLDLNKINVFMGPQSSGKSTISKIVSYCAWVEKDVATSQSLKTYQDNKDYFIERLEKYHKLKGYFNHPNRYVSYQSNVIEIEYSADNFSIKWKDQYAYKRSKISYIPSERNLVVLDEIKNYEFGDTNIRSFLFDWRESRNKYSKSGKMPILNLGVDYYYDTNSDEDHITKIQNGDSYDILLSNASSGLQSTTPLIAMVCYLTDWFYNQEEKISPMLDERKKQTNQALIEELILKKYFGSNHDVKKWNEEIKDINEKLKLNDEKVRRLYGNFKNTEKNLFSTHNTQFIIEEPEQNLFPETQRDLVYSILEKLQSDDRKHRLTITTHSPYILYALNNCMLGYLIKDNMPKEEQTELLSKKSWINPNWVSVWEIENGTIRPIKNSKTGTVSKHYFNGIMNDVMEEYYDMLTYLKIGDNEK